MNSFELWWHNWTVYIMRNYNMDYNTANLVFIFTLACIASVITGAIKGIVGNIERKKMKEAITSAISESKINITTVVEPASTVAKEESKVTAKNIKSESSEIDNIKKRLEEIRRQKEKLGSK